MKKLIIPMHLPSIGNQNVHWTKKKKLRDEQKFQIKGALRALQSPIELPCTITLTRCSSRFLDDDNLRTAFKHVRDQIAMLFFPGKRYGQCDSDPRLIWKYNQEKTKRNEACIKIIFEEANANTSLDASTKNQSL